MMLQNPILFLLMQEITTLHSLGNFELDCLLDAVYWQ
jgi:hypothetical protein